MLKTMFTLAACLVLISFSIADAKDQLTIKVVSANENRRGRSVTLRINQRISLEDVKMIATELKKREDIDYEKYFVFFLLPYQKAGAGAWARALFEPNLKAEILGATIDDVAKFHKFSIETGWQTPQKVDKKLVGFAALHNNKPPTYQHGGEIIGSWISDQPARKLTLFSKDGATYLNSYFSDGSQWTVECTTKKTRHGLRLEERNGTDNVSGDFYVVTKHGELELRDNHGLILALPPEKTSK